MRDLASAATNFRQKPCKLSLISSKLESICKIKVSKYEIKLTVFKVLLFLLRFPTYFFSYLTSFVSIDRYNVNLLANFVIIIYTSLIRAGPGLPMGIFAILSRGKFCHTTRKTMQSSGRKGSNCIVLE